MSASSSVFAYQFSSRWCHSLGYEEVTACWGQLAFSDGYCPDALFFHSVLFGGNFAFLGLIGN